MEEPSLEERGIRPAGLGARAPPMLVEEEDDETVEAVAMSEEERLLWGVGELDVEGCRRKKGILVQVHVQGELWTAGRVGWRRL